MKYKAVIRSLSITLSLTSPTLIAAQGFDLNGFATLGVARSDTAIQTQDGHIDERISFEKDTRLGVQFSATLNPQLEVSGQLLARAREENYDAFFDWGFVSYQATDFINIRAGKLKFPTFLISDYFEIGHAYPWIRPPEEVYTSNPISTIFGIDTLLRMEIENLDVLIQPYYGASKGATTLVPQAALAQLNLPAQSIQYRDFEAHQLIGFNASISTDFAKLRAGYLRTKVSADNFAVADDDASFASIGATLDLHNVVVYSEYFQREIKDAANAAFPNQKGWYTTLGYRHHKFLPHITLATLDDHDNPTNPSECGGPGFVCGTPLEQDSVTLGLRYELNSSAVVKAQAQHIAPAEGTRGLFVSAPGDTNIYAIAIDLVF